MIHQAVLIYHMFRLLFKVLLMFNFHLVEQALLFKTNNQYWYILNIRRHRHYTNHYISCTRQRSEYTNQLIRMLHIQEGRRYTMIQTYTVLLVISDHKPIWTDLFHSCLGTLRSMGFQIRL